MLTYMCMCACPEANLRYHSHLRILLFSCLFCSQGLSLFTWNWMIQLGCLLSESQGSSSFCCPSAENINMSGFTWLLHIKLKSSGLWGRTSPTVLFISLALNDPLETWNCLTGDMSDQCMMGEKTCGKALSKVKTGYEDILQAQDGAQGVCWGSV